jgi:uncharacterized protein YbaR (Trm112 family)
MQYPDLRPAVEAFKEGRNVMATLRELHGAFQNNDNGIEIAYDLQAGTYTKFVEDNRDYWLAYSNQLAGLMSEFLRPGDTTLDVGTGELTTLVGVARTGLAAAKFYGCDISFSRIHAGRNFADRMLDTNLRATVEGFVGNLFHLPYLDASIDVVWTSHALEPNGGKEVEAIRELLRVARRYLVLFEPSYENNSEQGRLRMEQLGYIRDVPGAIARAGGRLIDSRRMEVTSNPLNPTWAYVCVPATERAGPVGSIWACPASGLPMERRADCFFSRASRLAYPIIDGIPVLRREQAILASALD